MYRCSTTGVWILWIHFPLSDFGEKNSNLGIKNRSGFRFSQRNERVATWGLKSLITRASLAMRAPVQTCVATRDAFRSLACQFNLFCIPCDYLFFFDLFCFLLFIFFYFWLFLFVRCRIACARVHVRFWARSLATTAVFSKYMMIAHIVVQAETEHIKQFLFQIWTHLHQASDWWCTC